MHHVKYIQDNVFRQKMTYQKVLLTIFVVYIHAGNLDIYPLARQNGGAEAFVILFETLVNALVTVAVPCFFFISGYLLFQNYSKDKIVSKFVSRVKTLLVPFLFWQSVGFLFWSVLSAIPIISSRMNNRTEFTVQRWLQCFLDNSGDGPLWYVQALLLDVLLAPVIFLLLKNWSKKVYSGILLIVVWIVVKNLLLGNAMIPLPTVSFLAGSYIGLNHKAAFHYYFDCPVFNILLLGACVLVRAFLNLPEDAVDIISVITGIAIWNLLRDGSQLKYHAKLESAMFFIYAAHTFLLEGMEKVWFLVAGTGAWAALIDFTLLPVIAIGILLLLGELFKKVPWLWKVMTGSR